MQTKYSLPFRPSKKISLCDAPLHRKIKRLRHCLDFAMPKGTPILAARDGVVIAYEDRFKRNYKTRGKGRPLNFVIIRHYLDNEDSYYSHLSRVTVKIWQKVRRGQIIGYSGEVGYASYSHLHFGVYKNTNIKIPFTKSAMKKISKKVKLDKKGIPIIKGF